MSNRIGNTNSNRTASGEVFTTNNLMCKNAATFYKMVKINKLGGVGSGLRVHAPAAFTDEFQVDAINPTGPNKLIEINRLMFKAETPEYWGNEVPLTINDALNKLMEMMQKCKCQLVEEPTVEEPVIEEEEEPIVEESVAEEIVVEEIVVEEPTVEEEEEEEEEEEDLSNLTV